MSWHILRLSLAITFLWIGYLIFRDPAFWGGFLPTWAVALVPFSLPTLMMMVAAFDALIGFFLLINRFTRFIALIAAVHLAAILIVSGVDEITVRDIGLLGASLALALRR